MILADTSLWVDYLNDAPSTAVAELDAQLGRREVMMCGLVAAELLVGEDADERMRLWELFTAMPWADLDRGDFFVAGDVAANLREQGRTVPLDDVFIAAAAASRATLWTRDRHFEAIAEVLDRLDVRVFDS